MTIRLRYIWGETESEYATLYVTKMDYRAEYEATRLAQLPALIAKLTAQGLVVDASQALQPYLQSENPNDDSILG